MSSYLAFCKITSLTLSYDPLMTARNPFSSDCGQLATSPFRLLLSKNDLDILSLVPFLKQFLLEIENVCSKTMVCSSANASSLTLEWYQAQSASSTNNLVLASVRATCLFVCRLLLTTENSNSYVVNGLSTHSSASIQLPFSQDITVYEYWLSHWDSKVLLFTSHHQRNSLVTLQFSSGSHGVQSCFR